MAGVFSDTRDFSKSDAFSETVLLSESDVFLGGGSFSDTLVFSRIDFSETALFSDTDVFSGPKAFPEMEVSSETSLFPSTNVFPGAGGFSETTGFSEISFFPPSDSWAAKLSSSLAQGPRRSRLSLRGGGGSTSFLGMRGCCLACPGPEPSLPSSVSGGLGARAASTACRLCLRSCRVLRRAWMSSSSSLETEVRGLGASVSSTLSSLGQKMGDAVGGKKQRISEVGETWGDLTQWRSFQGCQRGGEEREPWPPLPPNYSLSKDDFHLLYIWGFQKSSEQSTPCFLFFFFF